MNLLNLLKYQLGSKLTEQIGGFLGEDTKNIQSGMDAVLPSVLSVFVKKASEQSGANELMDTIKHGNHDGSMLNYLTGLFSGGSSTKSLMSSGEILTNKFLGNKTGVLSSAISKFSGIGANSSNSLIKMAMPLVLGVIGKQVKNQNLDVSGLMRLLSAQKGHIGAAIPSGFTIAKVQQPVAVESNNASYNKPPAKKETVKTSLNERLASNSNRIQTNTNGNAQINQKAKAVATPPNPPTRTNNNNDKSGGGFLRFLPFIIAALLAAAVITFSVKSCNKKEDVKAAKKETTTAKTNPKKDAKETKDVATTDSGFAYTDDSNSNSDYSDDYTSTASRGELKSKLEAMIGKGSLGSSPIEIEGLQFRGGTATIRNGSRFLVSELASVLQSNPNLRIKLESFEVNRAISMKKGLMDAGINRDRIVTASGGGSGVQMYMY